MIFRVAPGADPAESIRLDATGANSAMLNAEGDLVLGTATGDVQLKHPDAYQEIGGIRRPVRSEFRLAAKNTVQFEVGAYDRSKPLVIDPSCCTRSRSEARTAIRLSGWM